MRRLMVCPAGILKGGSFGDPEDPGSRDWGAQVQPLFTRTGVGFYHPQGGRMSFLGSQLHSHCSQGHAPSPGRVSGERGVRTTFLISPGPGLCCQVFVCFWTSFSSPRGVENFVLGPKWAPVRGVPLIFRASLSALLKMIGGRGEREVKSWFSGPRGGFESLCLLLDIVLLPSGDQKLRFRTKTTPVWGPLIFDDFVRTKTSGFGGHCWCVCGW